MPELLPVGTVVRVTRMPIVRLDGTTEQPPPPYTAIVRGYDMGRTKYRLGTEYLPGEFTDGGDWAFPHHVQALAALDADEMQDIGNHLAAAVGLLARRDVRHHNAPDPSTDKLGDLLRQAIVQAVDIRTADERNIP